MKKNAEKKIRMKEAVEKKIVTDKLTGEMQVVYEPMHYFYLCSGDEQIYLCKQRSYKIVADYFSQDLSLNSIYNHKWGKHKVVDKLFEKLPRYLADAKRHAAEYAA